MSNRLTDDELVSQLVASDSTNSGAAQGGETVLVVKEELEKIVHSLRGGPLANPYTTEPELQQALQTMRPDDLRAMSDASPTVTLDRADASSKSAPLGMLGQYQLLQRLGAGGMGTVYKALHTKLKRPVALKVLQAGQLRSADAVSRFEREMHAVGMLQHPNIVGALDAGEIMGTHFLVMELVDGQDLASIVKTHGPLPIADACELTRQAAIGLQHIAENGLVHRDIKPSNLMLARSRSVQDPPSVKILDLGLALLSAEHANAVKELTATGQLMGTIDFMAPEQGHDTHTVDIRADLYSLGATLYKLLTGKAPFDDAEHNTVMKRMLALDREAPKPVSMFRQDCPAELETLAARLLAKSPDDRPATARELADSLAQFTGGADLGHLLGDEPIIVDPKAHTRQDLQLAAANQLPPPPTQSVAIQPQDRPQKRPSASRWKSRRIWAAIAVVVAVLGLLAPIFQHAVILIATGQGELTIESDDPDVEVTITQNDVVLFQKSKQRKFRVKPVDGMVQFFDPETGVESLSKKFELKRPGQQSRVTITAAELAKSDKPNAANVLKQSDRSAPAAAPVASPKPRLADNPKPFAILRNGQFVKDFPYCPVSLPEYQDGDVIEVRANGPFRLPKMRPSPDRGFDLRAAEGYHPVFIPADDVQLHEAWILVQHGRLRLEGCEFRRTPSQSRTMVYALGDSCEILNCTLIGGYSNEEVLIWVECPEALISDCLLSSGHGGHPSLHIRQRAQNITIRNSLYQTMASGFIVMDRTNVARTLRLENNTFFGHGLLLAGEFIMPTEPNQKPVATSPTEVIAERNCFIGNGFTSVNIQNWSAEQFKSVLSWRGKENLATASSTIHQVENLRDFESVVGAEQLGISSAELQLLLFQGWSPQANFTQWMESIRQSISRSLPKDVTTIGPDWNLVGPGEAYRRTLDPSERDGPTEDALEGGPFTLLHANSPARGFVSLSDAVAAAQNGDTIELRTDEAVTVTLDGSLTGRQLTMRAAPGYQPKYVDASQLRFGPGHNWNLCNLILHGALFTHPAGGIARLQNCTFDAPIPGISLTLNDSQGPALEIINCLVPTPINFQLPPDRRVVIRNSVMQNFVIFYEGQDDNKRDGNHKHCEMERSVFWVHESLADLFLVNLQQTISFVTSARQCVFDARCLSTYHSPKMKLAWAGDHNLFRFWDLSIFPEGGPTIQDLTQWQKDSNSDQHSLSSPSIYFDPAQWQVLLKDGTPAPAGVDFSRFRRPMAMQ